MNFVDGAEIVELADGQALIEEGAADREVFFVVEGSLEVTARDGDQTLHIARLGPGDLTGEMAEPVGGARTASVRASGDCVVLRSSREAFDDWLAANPIEAAQISDQSRRRVDERQMTQFLIGLAGDESVDVVAEMVAAVEWMHLPAGSTVFEQGDPSDAAYFVVAGRLRVVGTDLDGVVAFDHELGRGDVVGEMGLIDAAPRSGSLYSIRDATLARLPLETFQQLMVGHPAVMLRIFRHLLVRLVRPVVRNPTARSITVAVTSPADRRVLASQIAAEIGRYGSVRQVRAALVDSDLHVPGVAQAEVGTAQSSRVVNLLHEYEMATDFVVYETDTFAAGQPLTPWTIRSIRQADRLLVVSSAKPDEHEQGLIDQVVALADDADHLVMWSVVQHPSGTERADTRGHPLDGLAAETHHLRAGHLPDVERLARLASGNGVALVLGGGGARGYAHIGAVRALREAGVPIDRIGGASIGSVVAGSFAKDMTWQDAAVGLFELMSDPVDYTIPIVSLAKGERIATGCEAFFGDTRIEDMWIPFFCVSTNLTRSRVERHERGLVADAVRASVAIPGVFPPVPKNGDLLVDGGVLNNLPVDVVAEDPSIRHVIAIEVSPPLGPRAKSEFGMSVSGWSALKSKLGKGRSEFPAMTSVLMSSLLVGSTRDRRSFIEDGLVDLLMNLNLTGVGLLEFGVMDPVIERGYAMAQPLVAEWAASMDWLDSGPAPS